jgi:hypothetical protein
VWDFENPYTATRPTTPSQTGAGFRIFPNWMFQSTRYSPQYAAFTDKEAQLFPAN